MNDDDLLRSYIEERVITPRPDCKIWANACDRGYGRMYLDGTAQRVHRVMWELEHGPVPEGLTIDHLCRVRSCVNTEHMELVTQGENNTRGAQARTHYAIRLGRSRDPRSGRRRKRFCSRGHEWTDENTSFGGTRRRCLTCAAERARPAQEAA